MTTIAEIKARLAAATQGPWNKGDVKRFLADAAYLLDTVEAAKDLLLAATGPKDGPTSWKETCERWLHSAAAATAAAEKEGKP